VFAHVSDPHFGIPAISQRPIRAMGQSGHDLVLCQWLPTTLEHLRERTDFPEDKILPVVMTGDLTRTGLNPDEFVVGRDYFLTTWPNPQNLPNRQFGLSLGNNNMVMIPGNHDHWDGDTRNQWGYNAAIKPSFFPSTPFQVDFCSLGSRLVVELYGVDSCSGFPPIGAGTNRRARGSVANYELNTLIGLLNSSFSKQPTDRANGICRVRVMLCHHSLQGNWLISWFFGSLELHTASKNSLLRMAGRYQVAAILTGHSHDYPADRYDTPGLPHKLYEFRSPTTLQAFARPFKQGFYGHRILVDDDGQVSWSAYPYLWQGTHFYPLAIEEGPPLPGEWNPFHFPITF
jgi:hypothetical protein